MLARRIIAVSPDKAFGKQLAVALKAAGGTVDLHASLDELGKAELTAALLVVHLEGDQAVSAASLVQRLTGDTRLIAILPRSNLAAVVDIMQASDRVAGMLVAEDFDVRLLAAMATRVLAGDIFGLEKLVLWGTQIHSFLVGDYQEKALCISRISEFAEAMGVRRKYRESIEQCLDEMLMNALYDAPVDEQGRPIFSDIPTKTRISLRVEQKAVVQYACDGKQFTVAVRDAFGTLERATVLRYLHKCLHNEQQIDRKAGGAGLGLYLMTSSSTSVYFNVLPGVATEAVCTFDLEQPKLQLESFGFFYERIDAAGRLAGGPSKRLPAGASHPVERRRPAAASPPRGLVILLTAAIVATLGLVAIAAYPRLFAKKKTTIEIHTVPAGAMIEIEGRNAGTAVDGNLVIADLEVGRAYPIVARLEGYAPREAVVQPHAGGNPVTLELAALAATVTVDSAPTGAAVEVDGKDAGTTPTVLKALAPGSTVTLTFKKAGYHDAVTKVAVPGPGKESQLTQPLSVSDELARVLLTSDPPGAQVVENGQLLAGVSTPCELLVEAEKPVRFVLQMPHKIPAVIDTFVPPRGADGIAKSAKLADGLVLRVTSNVEAAKLSVAGVAACKDASSPLECLVAAGPHTAELVLPGMGVAKLTHTVTLRDKQVDVKFDLGTVEAAPGKLVQVGAGPGLKKVFMEAGTRHVTVLSPGTEDPPHPATVVVRPGGVVVAQ